MASKRTNMRRYAAALVAGTALVAPSAAWAATLSNADNTDGTVNTIGSGESTNNQAFFAPVVDVDQSAAGEPLDLTLGRGQNVTAEIQGLANVGNVELIAYYYDSNDNFIEDVVVASDTTPDGDTILAPTNTLATNTAFTNVRFGLRFVNGGDGVSTGNAIVGLSAVQTNVDPGTDTDMRLVLKSKGLTSSDSDSDIADALKNDSDITSYDLGSYSGPVITSAQSDFSGVGTPNPILLGFNVGLEGLAAGTDQASQITPLQASDGSPVGDPVKFDTDPTNGAADNPPAGTRETFITADETTGNAQWDSAVDEVSVEASSGNVTDLAGNTVTIPQTVTITPFGPPAFAGDTADVVVTGGTALDTDTELQDLYDDGIDLGGETVELTFRLSEPLDGTGVNSTDDITVSDNLGGSVAVTTIGANSDTFTVTVTSGSTTSDGDNVLTVGPNGGFLVDGTPLTANLAVESGDVLRTAQNVPLASDDIGSDEQAFMGVVPGVTLSTLDDDANGTLDGAQYEFIAPLATPLPAVNGIEISDDNDSATAAVTVSTETGDDSVLKAVAAESALTGFLDSGETAADNLNTGTIGGDLPYEISITDAEITYSGTYDVADGELLAIADQGAASPGTDGASPIVLSADFLPVEGTDPAAGNLRIVASEAINRTGVDEEDLLFGGSPLNLVNLNVGLPADLETPGAGRTFSSTLSETNTANDTITLGDGLVSDFVAGTQLTLGNTPGIVDTAPTPNPLATQGVNVGTGDTVFEGPSIQSATAFRSSGDVDGNVDRVLVQFDKNMQLDGGSAFEDGQFKLEVTGLGGTPVVSIPGSNVDTAQLGNGYVILTVPAPGIVGGELNAIGELTVEVDQGENVTLQSTDGEAVADDDGLAVNDFSTNEPDASTVVLPDNSNELYTMELTGTLNSGGSAVREGTIVRADLVSSRFTDIQLGEGTIDQVPCNDCRTGGFPIDLEGSGVQTAIREARLAGERRVEAFLGVDFDNQGKVTDVDIADTTAALNTGDANVDDGEDVGGAGADGASTSVHRVTIDVRNGRIRGDGVRGSVEVTENPASGLVLRDTSYQVTDDQGFFRLSVGQAQQSAGENEWVLVSVREPQADDFTAITYSSPSLDRYVPFASNVTASGTIGGKLGTVELDDITTIIGEADDGRIEQTAGLWQLIGWQGNVAENDSFRGRDAVDPNRLFIGLDEGTGEPQSAWLAGNAPGNPGGVDNDGGNSDELFTLTANQMTGAFQLPTIEKEIDNIRSFPSGQAMAFNNDGDDNNTRVFLPLEGSETPTANFRNGWSLVTFDADQSLTSSWAESNNVGAVIDAGGGDRVKTWFRDSSGAPEEGNTLNAVSAGDRAFVYFQSRVNNFGFGR